MVEEVIQPLTKPEEKKIEKTTQDLLKKLGVSAEATLEDVQGMLTVSLTSEDSGMLIGYHGEILEALQLVLSLIVAKKIGRYVRISLEIGDYKKNRIAYLENLALQTREQVLSEKKDHTISSLKSWERRVVHMIFQDDKDVTSESVGEGRDRVLIIRPR